MFRLSAKPHLEIDLHHRTLSLYQGEQLLSSYPIAIGKAATPSPVGSWEIINKKILSDQGVYGSRWMGLSAYSYGIHGTNTPSAIGTSVSAGCIRMYNPDIEALFPLVPIGTPVHIMQMQPIKSQHSKFHTIQAGDTLWLIAQQYQLSLQQLLAANPTINPAKLPIGAKLILP